MRAEDQPQPSGAADRYADAVGGALDRLAGYGPEWGSRGFAFHAPMAAEALARLGYVDEVPEWIGRNCAGRGYGPMPEARWPLRPDDQVELSAALGDFGRVAAWTTMFREQLATVPWPDVLRVWWPRLLPGLFGALGHGLIRTAHAVRALRTVPEPTGAYLGELARGLGYWASRYYPAPEAPGDSPFAAALTRALEPSAVPAALDSVIDMSADLLARRAPVPVIPLVHMVTIPGAVGLVLPVLPDELHRDSYRFAVRASAAALHVFRAHLRPDPVVPADAGLPALADAVEAAVETDDEHAIKLAEVVVRSAPGEPDGGPRVRALATVVGRVRSGQGAPGG